MTFDFKDFKTFNYYFMEVTAKLNNLRMSPRKVRLVADLIRGLSIKDARVQLNFLVKKSSSPILKLLNSAAANARHNLKLDPEEMYISAITVDGGPVLKRTMPRAMGRAYIIRKRTSHVRLTLSEKKDKQNKVLNVNKKPVRSSHEATKGAAEKKMPEEAKKEEMKEKTADNDTPKKTSGDAPKKRLTGLSKRAFIKK